MGKSYSSQVFLEECKNKRKKIHNYITDHVGILSDSDEATSDADNSEEEIPKKNSDKENF